MKKILLLLVFASVCVPALAWENYNSHAVSGYTRSNGTYVQPHYQSNSNATKQDNWSTSGNSNPYTGQQGYTNVNTQQQNYGYNNNTNSSRSNYGY
jgi:hypothetical protein